MSNEQVKELLDMVMALPKSDSISVKFEVGNNCRGVSIFVYSEKRCECCGKFKDMFECEMSDEYDVIKEFINKWKEIIENDGGNN